MAPRKRTASDTSDGDDRAALKQPRTDTSHLHPSVSLVYPSLTQPSPRTVPFQQPLPLISFSYNQGRELEFSDAAMRYYIEPPPGADLGYGYDRWVRRPEEKGRLDGLLRAVSETRRRGASDPAIGVISWRGIMTKILTAPYEDRDGWELNIMHKNGTLYFEEFISDSRLKEKDDMAPHQRVQMYYGYAFESWCTASQPDAPSGWGGDVDTSVQWCRVVKTKLGDTRIVIGGEVDCVKNSGEKDLMVELKTSMNIRGYRDEERFEKWTCHVIPRGFFTDSSHQKTSQVLFPIFSLRGTGAPGCLAESFTQHWVCQEIIVGFRTPNGRLTTVQPFKTLEIPRMVRGKPNAWDAQICLDWGERFLTWVRKNVVSGDVTPESVWRVKFTPRVGVELTLLHDTGRREVEAGEDRVGFLPTWYWEELCSTERSASSLDPPPGSVTVAAASGSLPGGWQI